MDALASLQHFIPHTVLIGTALLILVLDLFGLNQKVNALIALVGIALSLWLLPYPQKTMVLFSDLFFYDVFSYFLQIGLAIATSLAITSVIQSKVIPEKQKGEFYFLITFLFFLLILMGSTTNLLMIFLAIESVSLSSYILTGFRKFDKRSSEASLKYLLFGGVSSACMLFGMSIIFGLTGTLELAKMSTALAAGNASIAVAAKVALVFMLVGFGFKISAAPFHAWAPDVYEGAPTPVAAFLTVAPKSIGFLVICRVLFSAFHNYHIQWSAILVVLSILTMTIGNVIAVSQSNAKRLLAYSSVAQAGYILMGLATASGTGVEAVFIYLIAYIFTNMGAFLTLGAVEESEGSSRLDAFNGLSKRNPFLAACMTIFMLSLAGIPPLAGFIGKWFVFASAIQSKFILLAVVAAINSAVAGFYYFKIVRAMYLTNSDKHSSVLASNLLITCIVIALFGTIAIGLFPSSVISFVQVALVNFFSI